MKTLYLLRHANAANPSGVGDELRPLSAKGKAQAKQVGLHLKEAEIAPDIWLVSSAKRTQETCERVLLAGKLNTSPIIDKELYLATAGEIIKRVNQVGSQHDSVMVVAHNPGIEQLVKVLCLSRGTDDALAALQSGYPTATLAKILFDIGDWKEMEPNTGYLKDVFVAH